MRGRSATPGRHAGAFRGDGGCEGGKVCGRTYVYVDSKGDGGGGYYGGCGMILRGLQKKPQDVRYFFSDMHICSAILNLVPMD